MRHARRLRRQLDDWQQLWRQVDAFVDRVASARDEDAVGRRKTDALLAAAGVVERQRSAARVSPVTLGDPVVDRLPTAGWDPQERRMVPVPAPWTGAVRRARLPGNDDVELAVADLATVSLPGPLAEVSGPLVLDAVRLVRARGTLAVEIDDVVATLWVPSYPGAGAGIVTVAQADLEVDSLFSADDRYEATTSTLDPAGDGGPFVKSWSWLVGRRRATLPTLDPQPPLTSVGATSAGPLSAALLAQTAQCVADALEGRALRLPPGAHAAVARGLADAATTAAASTATDADVLRAAALVVEEEGVDSDAEDLADALSRAADAVAAPERLTAVATAAANLAATLTSFPLQSTVSGGARTALRPPATALQGALAQLPGAGALAGVLATAVEHGLLAAELDAVLADRIAYPDGSLRLLRTLEITFARWWPVALRWMAARARPGRSLDRAMRRFLDPFVRSLAALVTGTGTGVALVGLRLGEPATVSAPLLVAEAPASLASAYVRTVEAGQVAVLPADRPAAALVLGVGRRNDRLAVHVAPLRVSLVPPDLAPGSAGLVPAGTALVDRDAGLSAAELRRGFAADPARDGLVEQAVALHSQLALLVGRSALAGRLGAVSGGATGGVSVPDPSGPALHSVTWHGTVAPMTSAFVLHGAPEGWWDRSAETPLPTFVRPGELLLLRGVVPPDPDGAAGGPAQTVVEVDRAVWLPGSMLDRLDLSRAALLATDPAVLGDVGGPALLCEPRADLVLLTLRRTWQAGPLQGPVTLRRDFAGFDLASLAIGVPLGDQLVRDVTGSAPPGPAGVDRTLELGAATGLLDDWTRHAR